MTTATMAGIRTVDAATRAGFAASDFGFKAVHGTIAVTDGTVEFDADGHPRRLAAVLDPASVDTGNPRRDRDLRSRRFLEVADHPRMEVPAGTSSRPSPDGGPGPCCTSPAGRRHCGSAAHLTARPPPAVSR
jgi:polyisoprenoid-binding protein YceI